MRYVLLSSYSNNFSIYCKVLYLLLLCNNISVCYINISFTLKRNGFWNDISLWGDSYDSWTVYINRFISSRHQSYVFIQHTIFGSWSNNLFFAVNSRQITQLKHSRIRTNLSRYKQIISNNSFRN